MSEDGMAYENREQNIPRIMWGWFRISAGHQVWKATGPQGSRRELQRRGLQDEAERVSTVTKRAKMLLLNNWLSWSRIGCKFTEDQTKEKVLFIPGKTQKL